MKPALNWIYTALIDAYRDNCDVGISQVIPMSG
jgi:hypothetical protein